MKWFVALVLALCMVTPAFAGEDPYVAVVGNDIDANQWYFSPKYAQFLYDQEVFGVPVCSGTFPPVSPFMREGGGAGCEQWLAQTPAIQPEICDVTGTVNGVGDFDFFGNANARVTAGNSGWYEWYVRLPKKPSGEINLCIQCGVLKPEAFPLWGFEAIEKCAAETGERTNGCARIGVNPGTNPLIVAALPQIIAKAYPGPYAADGFPADGFNLTAFKNPGTYAFSGAMANNAQLQVLNGGTSARILLKSCMDKCIVVKLPVGGDAFGDEPQLGQVNALGQNEFDLEAGDIIYVRMNIPRQGTTDVYCNASSLKVMGIGESPF